MSTQLILYPQNYEGQYNLTSTVASEKVVDGISFSTINASPLADVPSNSPLPVIGFAQPVIINSWYRSRSTLFGTPAAPSASGNYLYLYSVASSTTSGVYQKLSNLTIGQWYDLYVVFTNTGASGDIFIAAYNGNNAINISSAQYTISTLTLNYAALQFQAQTTSDIVQINYTNTVADTFKIGNISVVPQGVTPSFGTFNLDDGQVICDLYQEEDIPLTLSIDDFKNVAEQVQSYSKDFSLPATKRNNLIFNNMFEVTRADDGLIFNPYVRTQCVLKQDGFILFQGYLRMIDVQDKDGEISYSVNLYSEVIALADILKERTFADLDLTELEHDYNRTSINNSWREPSTGTGLPLLNPLPTTSYAYDTSNQPAYGASQTNVLKYPFIDWTHQYLVGGSGSGTLANSGNPELTDLGQAFRPCIQLRYLINKIFEQTPFTWTSNLFDSADFSKLFIDFNWGADNSPVVFSSSGELTMAVDWVVPSTYTTIPFNEMDYLTIGGNALDANFGYSAGVFTAQEDGQIYTFTYSMDFDWNALYLSDILSVEWLINGVSNGGAYNITYNSGGYTFSSNLTTLPLQAGDTVLLRAKSPPDGKIELDGVLSPFGSTPSLIEVTTSINQTTNQTLLETLRGETGQWDFLKGIMTMFNLVSLGDDGNPNNIRIEPYSDIFIKTTDGITLADRSIEYDWTDKVDVSQMQLTPLTDLNKMTVFKFIEDDDDYVFNVYKESTSGHLYGSKGFDASGFTILEGKKEIIAEPFAATVSKPLLPHFASFIVPSIYALNDDGTSGSFENSPRIFYNNGVKNTGATYYIPEANGVGSANESNFLQFSHLSAIPTVVSNPPLAVDTRDFVFESSQLLDPIGNSPTNNLFNNYWLPYYAELYNADTRLMTLKVNLTPSDINIFKMTDTVMIKNRSFRVNKIEYKPNDLATVEFILIP